MARDITITQFGGSIPRVADHLVPPGQARRALDCRLENGELASWREPRLVRTFDASVRSAYHAFNCCWVTSTKCAHWAEGSTEQRHVFATGYNDFEYPVRIVMLPDCTTEVYRLGLPCPPTRPTCNIDPNAKQRNANKAAEARAYAYQFRDRFGNRSSLSEPSQTVVVREGAAVQVGGWAIPPGGWDITEIVVFRSVAGFDNATQEGSNTIDAAWMQIATLPPTTVSFVDAFQNIDLDEALKEDVVEPPPASLQGLTWLRSINTLVGFSGRRVYFSENNNYHNWPHSLLLDDNIKAIVESNDTIYVATDGAPYVITGKVECQHGGCRSAIRMPQSLPLVGGGFRSLVAIPSGAVYPSHQGLVVLSGNSAPTIATALHYGTEKWQQLHPDTMRACYFEGRLFAFFRRGGFCLALRDGAGTAAELDAHTELSLKPEELFVSRSGRFYMRIGTELLEWDRGDRLMPHTYESGITQLGVPFNFGALQLRMDAGAERVQLYVDGDEVLNEPSAGDDTFPLPTWATGTTFRWILSGTARVSRIGIAPSFKEL